LGTLYVLFGEYNKSELQGNNFVVVQVDVVALSQAINVDLVYTEKLRHAIMLSVGGGGGQLISGAPFNEHMLDGKMKSERTQE
jgi:hypothetical protein